MTKKIQSYLQEIKAAILTVAPDAEIILFGSQARGDAREDSDIDLLVLVEGAEVTGSTFSNVNGAIFDIWLEHLIEVNPVIRTKKEWNNPPFRTPFYMNVMNEGIKL